MPKYKCKQCKRVTEFNGFQCLCGNICSNDFELVVENVECVKPIVIEEKPVVEVPIVVEEVVPKVVEQPKMYVGKKEPQFPKTRKMF